MPRIDGVFLSPSEEVIVNRISQFKEACMLNSMEEKRMIFEQEKEIEKLQTDVKELKEIIRAMMKMIIFIGGKNEEEDFLNAANLGDLDFVRIPKPTSTAATPPATSTATPPASTTTIRVEPAPY